MITVASIYFALAACIGTVVVLRRLWRTGRRAVALLAGLAHSPQPRGLGADYEQLVRRPK